MHMQTNIEYRISNIEIGVVGPSIRPELLIEQDWKVRAKKVTPL